MGRLISEIAMKRLIISLAAISALISCTQEYRPQPDPYVAAQGTCVFKAQIELLQGSWVWNSATDKVGIYADNLTNASFLPRVAYNGKEGVVELMGEGALGQAYAYFPYSPDGDEAAKLGRQPLSGLQTYQTGNVEQIHRNTTLVTAADEDGLLRFRYLCGTLHLQVKMQFAENIQSITLSSAVPVTGWLDVTGVEEETMLNPGYTITVTGINRPCTEASPLDVWVMLPEGTYNSFSFTAAGATESLSTIIEGPFQINAGEETSTVAQEKKVDYDGSNLEAEEVDYD